MSSAANATAGESRRLIVQFKTENPSAAILEELRDEGVTIDQHLGLGVYVCNFTGSDPKVIEQKGYVEGVLV